MDSLTLARPLEALPCRVETDGGAGLKTIRITPDGVVKAKQGTFIMDAEAAGLIIAEFDKHKTPVPIDYEHQTLGGKWASPSGQAPAAGWVEHVFYEQGRGLLGLVRWNAKAAGSIRDGEYLFLSPVVSVRKADRRAVALHSAGITNKPAIPGMDRLAASDRVPLDMETIAMADTPTADADVNVDPSVLIGEIKALMGLTELASDASIVVVLMAIRDALANKGGKGKPESSPATQASSERSAEVLNLTLAESRDAAREIDDRLKPYIDRGVLNPGWVIQMEAARHLAATDPARFEALMCKAVSVYPPQGRTEPPAGGQGGPRRGSLIAEARRSFEQDAFANKSTSEAAYVNMVLRDADMEPLADAEIQAHAIAKPVD